MGFGRFDRFHERLHAFFDRRDDLLAVASIIAECVLGKRLAEAGEHAVVIDDQAEVFARKAPIRAGNRLHQRVRLHRLVDVEGGQAFDVEAGQPHGADDRRPGSDASGP